MKKLRLFLNAMSPRDQESFSRSCGTTIGYLRKAISSGQRLRTDLCVKIEQRSDYYLMRWDLRPTDWHEHWPELIDKPGSPPVPVAQEVV
ncbi:Cro/Cl family transcriptional regulator [Paraburkholderia sp. MM6662-R1]|uniref:Cro/Cl family transcriptional regulator n=1 Tax=Paraburkholderia sp. MM6662-R1 TaxID=2991066 RepID=UPI003D1E85C9